MAFVIIISACIASMVVGFALGWVTAFMSFIAEILEHQNDSSPIEDTETEIPDDREPVSDQFPVLKPYAGMGEGQ